MKFRPCIDIHNGKVKQIVGGSLMDQGDTAAENYVSEQDAVYFADFYSRFGLSGGHIILLNPASSPYYEATRAQAMAALQAQPGKWQVGGGICPENASAYLEAGASHVIITSYVFRDGQIQYENLERMLREVGKEHLVLDLSCRRSAYFPDPQYRIVTDRWQKMTEVSLSHETMDELAAYCSEFLIHAADVEGKCRGIEADVVSIMGAWDKDFPVTYAGGVGSYEDLTLLKKLGMDRVDVTVGSALDLFGGSLSFSCVLETVSAGRKAEI